MKVVVTNAPPETGKDFAVDAMCFKETRWEKREFKTPIYEIAAAIYGVSYRFMRELATDRSTKEYPQEELQGKTPREVLIEVSEKVIKPFYGKDYFGKRVVKEMYNPDNVYLLSDGGFPEELHGIMEKIGPENLLVIRIMSEGKNFDNDSRRYLTKEDIPGVKIVDIQNNFDEQFLVDFKKIVRDFVGDDDLSRYPEFKPLPGYHIEKAADLAIQKKNQYSDKYLFMIFNSCHIYISDNATVDGIVSAYTDNPNGEVTVNG